METQAQSTMIGITEISFMTLYMVVKALPLLHVTAADGMGRFLPDSDNVFESGHRHQILGL
jgi:hypothetical protein